MVTLPLRIRSTPTRVETAAGSPKTTTPRTHRETVLYTASPQRRRTSRSEWRAVANGEAPVSAIVGIAKKLNRLQPNPISSTPS
jgi:hypothetical protein